MFRIPSNRIVLRPVARSRGITLVEVLVVIGIIGLLAALIAPAVQYARGAAQNAECRNHLKQLGIAFQNYHGDHGVFPIDPYTFRQILPYVEEGPQYGAMVDAEAKHIGFSPQVVRVYACPSDSEENRVNSTISYLVNEGLGVQTYGYNGMRAEPGKRCISMADVTDGTSHTACLAEKLLGISVATQQATESHPLRAMWYTPRPWTGSTELDQFADACANHKYYASPMASVEYKCWLTATWGYNHILPPNSPSCHNGGPMDPDVGLEAKIISATANHGAAVNTLFVDGSVRSISSTIERRVWRAAASRNGGETEGP